jgi:RsiW-degrading membrane proteinase PrsW (M82 family)
VSVRPTLITVQEPPRRQAGSRPVFATAALEAFVLFAVTLLIYILSRLVDYPTGNNSRNLFGLLLAVLPLGLWFLISWQFEQRVTQPRPRLLVVLGLAMLAANGIGIPLAERVFAVDQWLSTTSGLQRIVGYMLTAGFTQEFIKLAVVRFSVWNAYIRNRRDGIAYSIAAGLGYATILSLNYVLTGATTPPEPAAAALRVAGYTLSQMAISIVVGYALADLRIGNPSIFWLPISLAFAAFLEGLFVSFRAGVIVSGISERATGSQVVSGLGIAVFLMVVLFTVVRFLITNTESREQRSPEFHR